MKIKSILACIALSFFALSIKAQSTPWLTGGNVAAPGNFLGTTNGQPLNIKTTLNEPIFLFTSNINRGILNPSQTTTIRSIPGQVIDGYFGLGVGGWFGNTNNHPYSMVHLQGPNDAAPNFYGSGGWRTWMNTGMYMEENSDNMYVGMKNEKADGQGNDRSDAVVGWSDNNTGPPNGPDVLRFIYTSNWTGAGNGTNALDGQSLNGYEFMRMTANTNSPLITNSVGSPVGHVGIGPLFVYPNTAPQNRLHLNSEDYVDNYLQITSAKATGQLDTNGIKFGLYNVAGNNDMPPTAQKLEAGNAFLYNQEKRHLIFSTNHVTPTTAGGGMFNTNERVRITSFNAPTVLPGGSTYGTYIPAGSTLSATSDNTRVAISWNPSNPITRPLSLLHIGNNANTSATSLDGWRPWMEVGTFTNLDFNTSMYSGLKFNNTGIDAVLGWGYTASDTLANGSGGARLRVIFTTPTNVADTAGHTNGLEAAHFWSDGNNTRMALGNFQSTGLGPLDPHNTLEIKSSKSSPYWTYNASPGKSASGLRFTHLTSKSDTVGPHVLGFIPTKVLSVDSNGDVVLVKGGGGSVTGAQNGCSMSTISPTSDVVLGQDSAQYTSIVAPAIIKNPAKFLNNRYVPMNKHSIIFSDDTIAPGTPASAAANTLGNTFNIGVGFNPFANAQSKFFTGNIQYGVGGVFATAPSTSPTVKFPNSTFQSSYGIGPTGVVGYVQATGDFMTGVYGFANVGGTTPSPGYGNGIVGVRGEAAGGSPAIGVMGVSVNPSGNKNYGGEFYAGNSPLMNYGVYATTVGTAGTSNYAFYSNGDSYATLGNWLGSDSTLKTNIVPITNALSTIKQLKPKSFYFDTTNTVGLNFSGKKQYGFLAQNVKTILPELTNTFYAPNDSTGSTPYAAVNYNAFIGLLTAGMQQQQLSIDSLRNQPSPAIAANNGLSVNSGSVGLGGTLLNPTNIDLGNATNNFSFSNSSIPSQLWSLNPNGSAHFNAFGQDFVSGTGSAYFLNATNVNNGFDCRLSASNSGYATGYYTKITNSAGESRGFTAELQQDNNQTGVSSLTQSSGSGVSNTNTAFSGFATNAKVNYGANLYLDANSTATQDMYGVYARVGANNGGANSNFGLKVEVAGPANPTMGNYGVYASVNAGAGQTSGGSPNGTNFAGYFVGDVVRTGTDNFTSDRNLKQNIDTISNALNTVMQLQPKTFDYKQSSYPHMNLPSGKQYGLIAQDVQTILPELVNTITNPAILDTAGNVTTPAFTYLGLEYQQLTGIMIRAMQQQQAHINKQDSIINQLTNAINSCCSNNTSRTTQTGGLNTGGANQAATTNIQVTTLSDANVVVLNQNQPNPFAEQTVITYNIPQTANAAALLFYDVNGKQIQNVNITTKGKGQLNVYANDLTNGVYSYTLIVDGQIIDTKKMVKQQ